MPIYAHIIPRADRPDMGDCFMNLYYAVGKQQVGPIGKTELQALIKNKKVNARTLVWQDGMDGWQELGLFIRNRSGKR